MTCAVIMAGGEGARMRPFTYAIPKPLLPIGRKPIAQLIIERLHACGITDIIMSLNYGSDLIRAYFQDGSQFGVKVEYFVEPERLGTAGSLAYPERLREGDFLVTNGDILTDLNYREFLEGHKRDGAAMTVATRSDQLPVPYGVITLEGERVLGVEEKPVFNYHFNAGIYAVSPQAVGLVPKGKRFDMTDLINSAAEAGLRVRSHALTGLWFDLARVNDFEKAVAELEREYPDLL
jgi:NDP-sugar pyrophosphorylase family protein